MTDQQRLANEFLEQLCGLLGVEADGVHRLELALDVGSLPEVVIYRLAPPLGAEKARRLSVARSFRLVPAEGDGE